MPAMVKTRALCYSNLHERKGSNVDHYESALSAPRQHHFLFHLFRMDKEEHPMPEHRAARLLLLMKQTFEKTNRSENGRI